LGWKKQKYKQYNVSSAIISVCYDDTAFYNG